MLAERLGRPDVVVPDIQLSLRHAFGGTEQDHALQTGLAAYNGSVGSVPAVCDRRFAPQNEDSTRNERYRETLPTVTAFTTTNRLIWALGTGGWGVAELIQGAHDVDLIRHVPDDLSVSADPALRSQRLRRDEVREVEARSRTGRSARRTRAVRGLCGPHRFGNCVHGWRGGVATFGRGWGPTVWAESLLTYLAPIVLASGTRRPQTSALP